MPRKKCNSPPSEEWLKLRQKYPNVSDLDADAIYAFPLRLIDILAGCDPAVLSSEQRSFEIDLRQSSGMGFFLRQPFDYSPLAADLLPEMEKDTQLESTANGIKEMMSDEMRQLGKSELEIEFHNSQRQQFQERIESRRIGYAGWLATHAEFLQCRDGFRSLWDDRIRKSGRMPLFPHHFFASSEKGIIPRCDRQFYNEYMEFYRAWSIETLATWDLPVPMRAELAQPCLYDLTSFGDAGITFFLPWYLLVDKDIRLQDVVKHHEQFGHIAHLKGWFNREESQFGHQRFALMLRLYVYLELALKKRYTHALPRKIEVLDRCFAEFFADKPADPMITITNCESVRRIRQRMNRRMKRCHDVANQT